MSPTPLRATIASLTAQLEGRALVLYLLAQGRIEFSK